MCFIRRLRKTQVVVLILFFFLCRVQESMRLDVFPLFLYIIPTPLFNLLRKYIKTKTLTLSSLTHKKKTHLFESQKLNIQEIHQKQNLTKLKGNQ